MSLDEFADFHEVSNVGRLAHATIDAPSSPAAGVAQSAQAPTATEEGFRPFRAPDDGVRR
jgi:hypothetical protein